MSTVDMLIAFQSISFISSDFLRISATLAKGSEFILFSIINLFS